MRAAPRPVARTVERVHQLDHRALTQRVFRDQGFQLDDELGREAPPQVGVDAHLDRFESQLLEPGDLRTREVVVGEVLQRGAPPQAERPPEDLAGGFRFVIERGPPSSSWPRSSAGVDRGGFAGDHVAVVPGEQDTALPRPRGPARAPSEGARCAPTAPAPCRPRPHPTARRGSGRSGRRGRRGGGAGPAATLLVRTEVDGASPSTTSSGPRMRNSMRGPQRCCGAYAWHPWLAREAKSRRLSRNLQP